MVGLLVGLRGLWESDLYKSSRVSDSDNRDSSCSSDSSDSRDISDSSDKSDSSDGSKSSKSSGQFCDRKRKEKKDYATKFVTYKN